MAENTEQTSAPEALPALFKEIDGLKEKAQEYIPKLQKANEKAVILLQQWLDGGELQDDPERQELNDFLANIRSSGQKMQAMRMELTRVLDAKVKELISYEKPLLDDKDSLYTQCRKLITRYDQKKLDEKLRLEKEAADRKLRDDTIIDIKAIILKNLNELITAKTKKANEFSREYFEKSTLEDWDQRADLFRKMKPSLNKDEYIAAFTANIPAHKVTLAFPEKGTWPAWISKLMEEESYDKWNVEVMSMAMPIINEWRAKIPDLKAERIRINNIKDESDRQQAIADNAAKEAAEEKRRNSLIEQSTLDKSLQIDGDASVDKLENSFREQGTVQSAPDTGPTKLVLKFESVPKAYQPFCTILYHVFANKNFEGIVKKDKLGEPILDEKGYPEYIPQVQWWIDQVLKIADVHVPGTKVYQQAKTIVRK